MGTPSSDSFPIPPSSPNGFKRRRKRSIKDRWLDRPLIDLFFNPERSSEKSEVIKNKTEELHYWFSSGNFSKAYPDLFRLMWYSSLPCFKMPGINSHNMLQSCEWQGQRVSCFDIFKMFPTDLGMCCAFNHKAALKLSNFSLLVEKMQREDLNLMQIEPNIDDDDDNSKRRSVEVGKSKGLRLVLDQQSNQESFSTVQDDYHGLQLFIGNPEEFPAMRDRSVLVQPGHENFVEVSGYLVTSSPDIQSLNPSKRNCLFHDEGRLDFHSFYTYSTCKFECSIKTVSTHMGCMPWYMPGGNESEVCNPWQAMNFSRILGSLETKSCNDLCLPDCNSIVYSYAHTAAPFR